MYNMGLYLMHYASEYYDPVKAHEYYMKNRELKKKTSTTSLNETGKEAAKYVKDQLNEEKKAKLIERGILKDMAVGSARNKRSSGVDSLSENLKREVESGNNEVKQHVEQSKKQIESLNEKLKNMTPEQKKQQSASIKEEIARIRETNNQKREEIKAQLTTKRNTTANQKQQLRDEFAGARNREMGSYKNDTAKIREDYKNKYVAEMEKIQGDKKMQQVKKSSSKTSRKSVLKKH